MIISIRRNSLLTFFAALLLLSFIPQAAARETNELSLITVNGQAEIRVAPDEVIFRLGVAKLDKDMSIAQRQTDESVRQLLALARRFNIPAQDVKTDYISVEMKYETQVNDDDMPGVRRTRREFSGYEVSKSVTIRFTELKRFDEFFSEILKTGVSGVNGVEFRSTQLRKYRDQARAQAIQAAKEKAEALARQIGQKIGRAHKITEDNYGGGRGSNTLQNFSTVAYESQSDQEGSAFAPGLISITAQVTASFILD